MGKQKFEPDKFRTSKISWDNHWAFIRSKSKEFKNGRGFSEDRKGNVSVPGFIVEVHAARYVQDGKQTYAFTNLAVMDGTIRKTAVFKKFYSEQYCITLAKRFAKRIAEGEL